MARGTPTRCPTCDRQTSDYQDRRDAPSSRDLHRDFRCSACGAEWTAIYNYSKKTNIIEGDDTEGPR